MDEFDHIARYLEQKRGEMKWQESVLHTAIALRMAHRAGLDAGRREVGIPCEPVSHGPVPQPDGHP